MYANYWSNLSKLRVESNLLSVVNCDKISIWNEKGRNMEKYGEINKYDTGVVHYSY